MKLLVPIVNRTNYTKLKSLLLRLQSDNGLEVVVALSSGVVVRELSDSADDIYRDGVNVIAEVDCLMMNDSLDAMVKSLGLSLIAHSSILKTESPNALLVVGDRYDMLGPVLSSKMMNIPIFHLQGGEHSGSIDNTVRDIITLCSNRHYVSTDLSHKRVVSLVGMHGVYNTGCPAVEWVSSIPITKYLDVDHFSKHFKDGLPLGKSEPYFVVIVHPDTTNPDDIDMGVVLRAVLSFGYKCVVVYPNIDAFNNRILHNIRDHKQKIICIKHAPIEDFVQLVSHARCVIGNSSAGIREVASFAVPVVNIGNRQHGRERNDNTIDVVCEYNSIVSVIQKSLGSSPSGKNVYFKEGSIEFICSDICEELSLTVGVKIPGCQNERTL